MIQRSKHVNNIMITMSDYQKGCIWYFYLFGASGLVIIGTMKHEPHQREARALGPSEKSIRFVWETSPTHNIYIYVYDIIWIFYKILYVYIYSAMYIYNYVYIIISIYIYYIDNLYTDQLPPPKEKNQKKEIACITRLFHSPMVLNSWSPRYMTASQGSVV